MRLSRSRGELLRRVRSRALAYTSGVVLHIWICHRCLAALAFGQNGLLQLHASQEYPCKSLHPYLCLFTGFWLFIGNYISYIYVAIAIA